MYSCIIFDIDGTIINNEEAVLKSFQSVLKDENINKTLEELTFSLGIPGLVSLTRLGCKNQKKAIELWGIKYNDYKDSCNLFDGIENVVSTLSKNNITLGVVTSKNAIELKTEFLPYKISNLFKQIICCDDVIEPKPSGESLVKIMNLLGVQASDTLYIGDSIYDMGCAKNAGVDFAIALWGAHDVSKFEYFTHVLKHPEDILLLLNK